MAKIKKNKIKLNKSGDIHAEIRGLGVLIEHVDDKVSTIAEQYGDIKKDIGGIKNILDSHTKTLDSHTEMIGRLTVDVEIIKQDTEFIKNSLKRKVDVEEFTALERRVALLERRR